MFSIDKEYDALYEIQKSKFYSFAYPVFDVESVNKLIDKLHDEYGDATHICYAYTLDAPKTEKANDDGEPNGTAGKPLLELLKKKNLHNVLIVVIRYFGGIKLGAGGLVRAYTSSGNLALDKAKVVEFVSYPKYLAKIDITMCNKLKTTIIGLKGEILNENYSEYYEVEFLGDIKDAILSRFVGVDIKDMGSEIKCR